ncbi:MAG: hypothetical protein IJT49_10285 [Clostridia bacterium]|nr:hypothetical protein [Clostridia bacterium]
MKRILSTVLAICMIVSLLPVLSMAKGVAISHVDLTGFAEPNNSSKPGFTLVMPDNAHYKLDESESIPGIEWRDLTAGKDLTPTDKFVDAHEYRAIIHLKADSDYYFYKYSGEANVMATVNGETCNTSFPYNSERYLDIIYYPKVVGADKLEGYVFLIGEPTAGVNMVFGREGAIGLIDQAYLNVQWQRRSNKTDPFENIEGAVSLTYRPTGADVGKYLRVKVGADGYYNYLTSTAQLVVKAENNDEPKEARFYVDGDQLYLMGVVGQQYLVTQNKREIKDGEYDISEGDWWVSNKIYYSYDVKLNITNAAELNKNIYVYTRIMETDEKKVGTKVAYSEFYFKENYHLTDLFLSCQTPDTELVEGGVAKFHVDPLPENATNFNGIRGDNWTVDGSYLGSEYAKLFANPDCTAPLNESTTYTTVYVKLYKAKNDLQVTVQTQIGYTDFLRDTETINVRSTNGLYNLKGIECEDLLIYKGAYMDYYPIYPYPYPANLSGLVIDQSTEKGAPKVSFYVDYEGSGDEDGIIVDATEAELGTYTYSFRKDSVGIKMFKIVVVEYVGYPESEETESDTKKDPPPDEPKEDDTGTSDETSEPPAEVLRGDLDGDGQITNKDVVLLFRYVSGTEKAEDETVYDFDGDGNVDNKDVVALFRYASSDANAPKG